MNYPKNTLEGMVRFMKVGVNFIVTLVSPRKNIVNKAWVDPPQCMPEHCKTDDAVEAYRRYYILEKNNFAVWKYSGTPDWYTKGISHALL